MIRGQKVLLDRDLAELYGVATGVLNQAVKRNLERFPEDFMFQLSVDETEKWKSQRIPDWNVKALGPWWSPTLPYAFTEQRVAMLSRVLHSERAIEGNIMRASVRLREFLAIHKDLARKLDELEKKRGAHDEKFQLVFEAIRQLMLPPQEPQKKAKFDFARDL